MDVKLTHNNVHYEEMSSTHRNSYLIIMVQHRVFFFIDVDT